MVWLVALLSASLLGAGCGDSAAEGSAAAGTPDGIPILTQRHDGRTVTLRVGGGATLRVRAAGRVQASGRSVALSQVDFFQDPGYREWELQAERPGTTVITGPRTDGKRFRITIRVTA